jgi:5-methyltetrahydrofolate--homocysteine methyltransferase
MVVTAGDLKEAGIRAPLLVGGAALSDKFTRLRIAPAYAEAVCYAKDAMTGLRLINQLMDPAYREEVLRSHQPGTEEPAQAPAVAEVKPAARRSPKVRVGIPIPQAPYLDRKVRDVPQLAEVWAYINPQMLYGKHLGFRGNFEKRLAERDEKALELFHQVEEVRRWAAGFMKVRAVWQFFDAVGEGNSVHLLSPGAAAPLHTFHFGRQAREDGLSLADYVLDPDESRRDHIAIFVVTAGEGIRERAEAAKSAGEFVRCHVLQALALETAEGAAEWLHRRIREDWGFPDPPSMTMHDRFTSRYRGKRCSFGYGACPNLEDQLGIWKLLNPNEIGVELTDGYMMDPEASVSALVFHHPDCVYFTAGEAAT